MEEEKKKLLHIEREPDAAVRRESIRYFLFALALVGCVYLTELLHLLEKPLFSLIYYGYVTEIVYSLTAAAFLTVLLVVYHRVARIYLGTRLIEREKRVSDGTDLRRRIALYIMIILPVILTGIFLGFQFKIVYELGEKVNMYTLFGNLSGYALVAAKLFAYLYFIMLVQTGFERLFKGVERLPLGGVACMLVFGLIEVFVSPSMFSWLYFAQCLYYGIIYLVSDRRFFITYALMIILYVL